MSACVWILWGVLTLVNAALWLASWRNLTQARDLLLGYEEATDDRA